MRRLWPLLIALGLLAAACRAETNVVLDIREDGSGTYTVELGLDDELQELLAGFTGGEGGGIIPGFDLEIPGLEGNPLESLESRVEGDMTFYSNTETFSSPEELERILTQAGGENSFDTFEVQVEGEKVILRASAAPPRQLTGNEELPISLDIIEQAFSANVIVSLPGKIVERNADEVLPDGRLKWRISLTDGVDIFAVSDLGEGGFPWLLVILVIVGIGAIAAGVWLARRGMRRPEEAVAATAPPPPPMPFEPPADRAP